MSRNCFWRYFGAVSWGTSQSALFQAGFLEYFRIFCNIFGVVLVPGGEGAVGKGEMPVQELVFGGVVEADPIVQVQLPLRRALNKIYLFYK